MHKVGVGMILNWHKSFWDNFGRKHVTMRIVWVLHRRTVVLSSYFCPTELVRQINAAKHVSGAVWPEKNRQISVKVAQKLFH